jgi:hypothetical protein
MTLDDLTVNFTHLNREDILSDWKWLLGDNRLPVLIAASGDAFVQDTENGTIHWLDVGEGKLNQIAKSFEEFSLQLQNTDYVVEYFSVQMIGDLAQAKKSLDKGQIFSLVNPYVLGGEYRLDNIGVSDIEVHFSILGQIHQQVHNLPKGTPINSIKINEC